jgi:beta-lactam-binding protein with PASTA domain
VVPALAGKKLKAAKKKLASANCKLGKVTKKNGATARTGKVRRQAPKPGAKLPSGSKVAVVLKP